MDIKKSKTFNKLGVYDLQTMEQKIGYTLKTV